MAKKVTNISEVPIDESLTPKGGWAQLNIKWLVSDTNLGSRYTTVGRAVFVAGGSSEHVLHRHKNAEEIIIVLKGHGQFISGEDAPVPIGPGDVCYIPPLVPHAFKNLSPNEDLEVFVVYGGAPSLAKTGYEVI